MSPDLTREAEAQILSSNLNSQNISLLEAPLSRVLTPIGTGGGEVEVVEGAFLIADVGPSGTEADVVVRENTPGPDQISIYVVREGDNIGAIAEMFGVSVNTIVWANDLKSRIVKAGQELVILPVTGVRHEVKKGDTLDSIVKGYKANLEEVSFYNNISEDSDLALGSVVIIPDGEVSAKVSSPARGTSVGAAVASSGGGYFIRPTRGVKTQGVHGNNGVDIAAPTGTPIYASAGGTVIISRSGGWNGGYGNYVVIRHGNGMQTLYAHNSQNLVGTGQWVDQGQVIGYVGNTGKSTGSHLHFEVRGGRNPF